MKDQQLSTHLKKNLSSPNNIFSLLLEREEGREEGRKRNIDARERSIGWLPPARTQARESYDPGLGIEPVTEVRALIRIKPATFWL